MSDIKTPGMLAAAGVHADLLVRIAEITRALKAKGVIAEEDIKSSMTASQRDVLRLELTEQFLQTAERIAREESLSD